MNYILSMKNYLKTTFYKIKNTYNYYKELSKYTQKQSKFKLINFLCLIKYIIFEELSYILNLKLRIMNQLEIENLKEEAQKYIGREYKTYIDNYPGTLPDTYIFESTFTLFTGENNDKRIGTVFGVLKHVTKKKELKIDLPTLLNQFKKEDKK